MPVTPTYPGIYVEEVLSNAHSITAAPTSVTVFVGYTHPFKTPVLNFGQALQIFSFSDYERLFGPLYSVDWLADDVGNAVWQFFLNGGSVAWVVGLQAQWNIMGGSPSPITAPSLPLSPASGGGTITFTGLEPVDAHNALTVSVTNISPGGDLADVIVSYCGRVEAFRQVSLNADPTNSPELRIGTSTTPVSSLVTVSLTAVPRPTQWPGPLAPVPLISGLPSVPFTTYEPGDFASAFAQDMPLDKVSVFNLLLTSGVWDPPVVSEALAFCERKRAFFIMDPPADAVADRSSPAALPLIGDIMSDAVALRNIPKSTNGALYFPFLRSADPATGDPVSLPPSGTVAGVFAREDQNRGVWKAPAGFETILQNINGVVASGVMTDARQGTLNPIGVDCLRVFPGVGTVVFGARTLVAANSAFQQYRYVPVRRTALFIEQSLVASLGWVVFEPNDEPLWVSIRVTIENFMLGLFNQGAFQGSTPSTAFQVKCDATTTTPDDQANGVVNIVVAFAPLKPAEFVVIKIAQLAGQPQS